MKPERFDDFIGSDALIGRLKGVAVQPVHAYLFCGPEGTGKRTLAGICSRALNCAGEDRPCDRCPSCMRYLSDNHPDHIVLSSDKSIGVDLIRALIERVSIKPYEGGYRTVVIEQADRMTVQAQNSLLKTLEEPPAQTVFFLTAEHTAPLLPTILSRVRMIRFSPLADAVVAQALRNKGVSPIRAEQLSSIADGSVGRAMALDGDEGFWALRERVIQSLTSLKGPHSVSAAFAAIKDDKAHAPEALCIMEQLSRAAIAREVGQPVAESVLPVGMELPGDKLLMGVMRARQMLAGNVSWQSAVEMMYFDLMRK